jgi:pimeloyl-ACP methyl ester carboxylesterase
VTRAATVRRDDGPTIAYDVAGAGPLVVFVHGLTSSRVSWEPVTALLAREFTCVRVDLRGHGDSSTASDYSALSLVSEVRSVVEKLDIGEPAVVGHSLGATVAAVYAAVHPARAVICVDASLRFGDFARLVQRHANTLRSDRTMEAVLAIDHELGLEPYAATEEMGRRVLTFPREVLLGIWQALLTTSAEQLTAVAETILPRITAPLLALHGSPPPPDYQVWLTRLVPTARLEVWDGAGHMLHLVEPERFAARVRPLLAHVRANCRSAPTWRAT